MDTSKIIIGTVGGGRYTVTSPIVKEDYGLYLKIEGLELPSTYEVDFSNSEHNGTSVTMIGNADGVLIPRQFITTGKDVFAFLYHVGADYGRTVYKFRIPNKLRPDRTDEQPTPEEQSVIDQAISALNDAVEQTAQDVIDADASAQSASESAEQAETARDTAQTYANNAQTSANNASASASQASASATASAQSASQAEQIKTDVQGMVSDAQASASASAQSATASANSASQAQGYAQGASASAQSASGYASNAQTSANTASNKASEASTSASTASAKATEASQSASQALTYKTDAESAKTASQTAQGLAESARDSAISAKTDAESARDEAQSLVDGISGKVEQIDSNTERIESLEDDIFKPYAVDSASGAIASFVDGADDIPLKSLVVDINPVQDLHGQDAPYPAGGGSNIWDEETELGSWSDTREEWVTATAQLKSKNYIPISPSTTYRLVNPSGTISRYVYYDADKVYLSWVSANSNRDFTTPANAHYMMFGLATTYGTVYNHNISINYPSTDTSYHPYENICPISGWTGVDVEQSGVNVWDEEWELGYLNINNGSEVASNNSIRMKNYVGVKSNTSYFFSCVGKNDVFRVVWFDKNKNFISASNSSVLTNKVVTTPIGACYMRCYFSSTYGTTYNHDISINYPSADHSYHPYTGRSITIDLGQTVYGGTLNVLSGVLTVFPYYASYNGETLTGEWISDRDAYAVGTTPTIGAQVVNIGAQGVTIQLSANQINSLYGQNNIWADSGDTTAEYRADTKLFIERLTAPDSADMIADSNITSGKYFMVGNSLYKATANIANGGQIVVGTNCIRKSLSEALNEINA